MPCFTFLGVLAEKSVTEIIMYFQIESLDRVLEEKSPETYFDIKYVLYSLNIIFMKELLQILNQNKLIIEHV